MKSFFEPNSVAVIGASKDPNKLGGSLIRNLISGGFHGDIYPINEREDEIMGVKAYPSIKDIPQPVDLVNIIIPATKTIPALKDCVSKGVKAAIIMAQGFAELGGTRKEIQQEITQLARESNMSILGPNTTGLINSTNQLVSFFGDCKNLKLKKGPISIIAQSGTIPYAMVSWLDSRGIGISKVVGMGNKCDIDEADILEYMANDPDTKVVAMYLEDIKDGQSFLKAAKRVVGKKALMGLMGGEFIEGVKAANSHTAAIGSNHKIVKTAFKQSGAILLETYDEMQDYLKALAWQPLMNGNRIAVLTMSGGFGVLSADFARGLGLEVPDFSERTTKLINSLSASFASVANPIDFGGLVTDPEIYIETIKAVLEDENVDGMAIIIGFWFLAAPQIIDLIIKHTKECPNKKPITFYGMDWMHLIPDCEEKFQKLEEAGIPIYSSPERAIRSLNALYKVKQSLV